jgi:hypothetical protein
MLVNLADPRWLIFAASLVLQVLLLNALRRSGAQHKGYALVFAYSVVLFFTTVADGAVMAGSVPKDTARLIFYRNEAVRQFLLFAVVISLLDRSMREHPFRMRVRILLALAIPTVVAASLYVHYASSSHMFVLWMTRVTRDLSFGSVVLTLLLWLMLISSKNREHQLLMITGGLGLQFTGEAIGQSLRQMSQDHYSILVIGNLVGGLTHLLRLYVWKEAFRRPRPAEKPHEPGEQTDETFHHPAQSLYQSVG